MRLTRRIAAFTLLGLVLQGPAHAKDTPKQDAPRATTVTRAAPSGGMLGGMPAWEAPAGYSVDMIVTHGKERLVMRRHVDGARIRTDINASGMDVRMIELGDVAGTTYMVMPKEKQAIKQSRTAMMEQAEKMPGVKKQLTESEESAADPGDSKVEYLGKETLKGRVLDKYKATYPEGTATAWVDPATQAPVRMESADGAMEWENFKAEPQPPALFEVPKGYQVMDMDEMMKQMKDMKMPGGMDAMAGMAGMSGMPGMGGGLNGMAGRAGGNFGSQMGSQLGTTLGASFGGPLGAMAGGYLGGKIGGMIGRKAATAITPGN